MRAIPTLLATLAAAKILTFSLGAEDAASTQEAVARLEASKTFGVTPAGNNNGKSSFSPSSLPGSTEPDMSRVMEFDPFKSPILSAPPPEELQGPQLKQKPNRRIDRTATKEQEKEANWLLNGIEEQRKLMEEQQKSLNKEINDKSEITDDPFKDKSKKELTDHEKKNERNGTLSSPFNSGLGVYSQYTLKGMESLKQSSAFIDPLSMDTKDHAFNSQKSALTIDDPASAPLNATKVQSPIIDPLASFKTQTSTSSAPASRLSVTDWLAAVKEHERASLLPQQAPTIQNLYDQNQIHPKPPEVKLTTPTPLPSRPPANTMKNSLPPNRTIKDPNDF